MNFLSLLSPTSIMVGIIVMLSISKALVINLWGNAKDELSTYKAQVSLAQAQIEADVQRRLRLSDQVTADVRSDLDAALDRLRKRPAVRVLQSQCDSGTGLKVSAGTPGLVGAAPAAAPDTEIILAALECEEQLNNGIRDAARLAWWTHWYEEQREIYK